MQENRSFDSYFGTYPGADGIPMSNGVPTVCVPDPASGLHPAVSRHRGRQRGRAARRGQRDRGRRTTARWTGSSGSATRPSGPAPIPTTRRASSAVPMPDVMGYHTAAEIPNYWTYAKDFVLDDHMFEPVKSWSLPDHLYMVSAWSARCKNRSPMSCVNNIVGPYGVNQFDKAVDQELTDGQDLDRPGLDRHHLAAVRPPCQLGLLRPDGRPARLRR